MKIRNIIILAIIIVVTSLVSCTKDPDVPTGKVFNSDSGNVPVVSDCSMLRLNELNGNDKFIEIYNSGTETLSLKGVYIEKDGSQNWVGDETVSVEAGGYLVLWSEDVFLDHPDVSETLLFHSGFSAKKNIRIQLFTPAGESIDDFNLTNIDANDPVYIPAPASYSRNTDGKWYYSDATPGEVNVNGTVEVLGLEDGDTPEPPTPHEPDYTNLVLNELNGNDKFIEIYNGGAEAISLKDVYIEKDGNQNWAGDETVSVEAGGYLVLWSEDVILDHPDVAESLIFHSAFSAKKNVRIQLFSPAAESIDDFNLTNIDANDPAYIPAPASYSRNTDGKWYYSDATPGAANVDGAVAVLGLEGGDTPEPPSPEEHDYTNLVLNELNGDTKFIEFYNKGDLDLSMEGMYIMKDDYVNGAIWTADATVVIPAHGYVLLYSEDIWADHPDYPEHLFFYSGLSSKKTCRYTLFLPDGTVCDEFIRGTTGEWGLTITNVAPQSYARTPDGGAWKLTEATPGAANPAYGEVIPQE